MFLKFITSDGIVAINTDNIRELSVAGRQILLTTDDRRVFTIYHGESGEDTLRHFDDMLERIARGNCK